MHRYERSTELLEAEIGSELVALEPNAGKCFGFNEVAASVWRNLQTPKTLGELRDSLLKEYEVEPERCVRELEELLASMSDKGLIRRCTSGIRTKSR